MADNTPDLAQAILSPATGLSDSAKADAWDAFNNSASADVLAQKLQAPEFSGLSDDVKASLWDAKNDPQTATQKLALTRPDLVSPPPAAGPANPIPQNDEQSKGAIWQSAADNLGKGNIGSAVADVASLARPSSNPAMDQNLTDVEQAGVGAVKSAGKTAATLGNIATLGQTPLSDLAKSPALQPANENERAGGAVEQLGEYALGEKLLTELAELPMAERILKTGQVLDVVKAHPVLAPLLGAVKGAATGAVVGGIHDGAKGAVRDAIGGGILGGVSEAPGALKELWGSLDGQQIQSELQDGIRSTVGDAADEVGVKPADSNVRNSAKAAGDAVLDKSKGLYGEIDAATDGQLTNIQSKLQNVNLKLRTTAGTDDAAEELLESQRDKLESALEDVFDQAKRNGVDASVVDDARSSFKQSQALYDLDAQVKASTFGNARQAAENVDPKKLVPRLQKLADSGRLQDALGDKAADDLLGSAYKSHEALGDLADQTARRADVKRTATDIAKRTAGTAIGGGIVGAIYHALTGKKDK